MSEWRRVSFGADPRYQGLLGAFLTLTLIGLCVHVIGQMLGHRWLAALASGLVIVAVGWVYAARRGLVPLRGRRATAIGAAALLAGLAGSVMGVLHLA